MGPARRSTKPLIIPVFIPHAACPQRCLFCDQTRTTGRGSAPDPAAVPAAVEQFLNHSRAGRPWAEIAFYGGNFLGLAPECIQTLLETAAACAQRGKIHGIRFSTRPDTIDDRRLGLLAPYPVTTVELGVQSMNDDVLTLCRRGHTAECSRRAVAALRRHKYRLGLQMMIGLPGQSAEDAMETGRQIAALHPDFVRIYPLLVLDRSPLAQWYREGRYTPLALAEAVELTGRLYTLFTRCGIRVIRMGLQPTAELNPEAGVLSGPFHPAFGELVHSSLWLNALDAHLRREGMQGGSVAIEVEGRSLSRLKGWRNTNLTELRKRFGLREISARAGPGIERDTALVNGGRCPLDNPAGRLDPVPVDDSF